jgi:iron complex outermembrane receptor protein
MNQRSIWLPAVTSSMFCFGSLGALAAHAQDVTAAEGAAPDSGALEEVIVTAQRRAEDMQKAAVAITVLGADELAAAGVTEPENLNRLAPGLNVGVAAASTQLYMRGVGSYGSTAFADPAVQFTMDGVAYGRVTAMGGNFFDLQRVEILKGPQGTLYGRNATGGALNLISNKPKDSFEAGFGLDYGNYGAHRVNGFVNVPLGDAWALRIAGQKSDRDGYQTDGTNDDDTAAARLHLLYAPRDGLSLLLSASQVDVDGNGSGLVPYRATGYYDNSNPWVGPATASPAALQAQATENGQPPTLFTNGVANDDGHTEITVKSYGAQLDLDVGALGTLTAIANRLETDNDTRSYASGFLFHSKDEARQTTFEARIAGDSGAFEWVGGAFWYDEQTSFDYWVDQGFLFNQTGVAVKHNDNESWAVFGELKYHISDSLRVLGGLRYTDETKSIDGLTWNRQGAPCAAIGATVTTIADVAQYIPWAATNDNGVAYPFPYCRDTTTGDDGWTNTSWRAGVEYDLSPTSMAYFTASNGFKAGGFFAGGDNFVVGNTYEPETLTSYAFGSKNLFAGDTLRLNVEAFYLDYQDHQESYLAPTNPPVPAFGFITINVPQAEIYGLDVEMDWRVTANDRIGVRAQYLKAEYTDFTYQTSRPGEFVTGQPGSQPPQTVCKTQFISIGLYQVNCDGQEMPRSPEVSLQADYSHTFQLPNGGAIVPSVAVQYSDAYWTAVDYNELQRQDSFVMWDANLAYESSTGRWSAALYGRNLSNEAVWQNSFAHPSGVVYNGLRPPRTYGARVDFRF